tara:strand:+ start:222 stop:674 length:453 start_codon:yes stop_codon:yes gene_type:complete
VLDKLKVYRLEVEVVNGLNKDNYGPFTALCHNEELTSVCNRYKDSLGWVNEPKEDGIEGFHWGHKIGIHKASLVHLWFVNKRVMKDLFDAGFRLSVYLVDSDKVLQGETQCAFHPDNATLIEQLDFEQSIEYGYGHRSTLTLEPLRELAY